MDTNMVVSVTKRGLFIRCDKETIDNMRTALDVLTGLGKIINVKSYMARSEEQERIRRKVEREKPIKETQFRADALKIYSRFLGYMNNGCNGDVKLARKKIHDEYNLQYVDVDINLQYGKKEWKLQQKLARVDA